MLQRLFLLISMIAVTALAEETLTLSGVTPGQGKVAATLWDREGLTLPSLT